MKKILPAMLILIFLLCSCSNAADVDNYGVFDVPFELTADFKRGSLSGSFVFIRTSPEHCTLEFLSPQSIGTLYLSDSGGVVSSEFMGITHEEQSENLKSGNPMRALCTAFELFETEKPEGVKQSNGDMEYTLPNGMKITAYGSLPKSIEAPADELVIEITAFDFLK